MQTITIYTHEGRIQEISNLPDDVEIEVKEYTEKEDESEEICTQYL